jgi:NAD(P)-dependent dehydrogenase (short-subunit alcohol dehydrogenase family)
MSQETMPPQHQKEQPGKEAEMTPKPQSEEKEYKSCGRLKDKAALITGGDSGIGRAVAVAFAKEGADIAIVYLSEHQDAQDTKRLVEETGRRAVLISGDIGEEEFCQSAVRQAVDAFGRLDILVNNAAEQHPQKDIEGISNDQLIRTFKTNIFSMFYMVQAALPHLREGSAIVNSTSVTAYQGHPQLIPYASTKGAIAVFTRSLARSLPTRRRNGLTLSPYATTGRAHLLAMAGLPRNGR